MSTLTGKTRAQVLNRIDAEDVGQRVVLEEEGETEWSGGCDTCGWDEQIVKVTIRVYTDGEYYGTPVFASQSAQGEAVPRLLAWLNNEEDN